MNARLIADRFGVQSIHLGVPAGIPGDGAAKGFAGLVEATSLIGPAGAEIEAWLLANDAADGTMPTTPGPIARASIAADSDGSPVLYIVPLGSSMLIEH